MGLLGVLPGCMSAESPLPALWMKSVQSWNEVRWLVLHKDIQQQLQQVFFCRVWYGDGDQACRESWLRSAVTHVAATSLNLAYPDQLVHR